MITFEDGGQLESFGHKFGLPTLPIQSMDNMKHRYDPMVVQVTNLLMQDGKLSVAQTVRRQSLWPILAHPANSLCCRIWQRY